MSGREIVRDAIDGGNWMLSVDHDEMVRMHDRMLAGKDTQIDLLSTELDKRKQCEAENISFRNDVYQLGQQHQADLQLIERYKRDLADVKLERDRGRTALDEYGATVATLKATIQTQTESQLYRELQAAKAQVEELRDEVKHQQLLVRDAHHLSSGPMVVNTTEPSEHPDTRRLINQLYHEISRLERVVLDSCRIIRLLRDCGNDHVLIRGFAAQYLDTHEKR